MTLVNHIQASNLEESIHLHDKRQKLMHISFGEQNEGILDKPKTLPLFETAAKEARRPQAVALAPEVSASASASNMTPPAVEIPLKELDIRQFYH